MKNDYNETKFVKKLKLPKLIAVLGPTASGKTAMGIELAKKFQGEIISADSRQIYKYMDIGTAKEPGEMKKDENGRPYLLAGGIRHYGIDLVDPGQTYTVAEFKQYALDVIKEILKRRHLPMLVGGTGFYIRAIVENLDIPKVAPNKKLRKSFEEKSLEELVKLLKDVDPRSAKKVDLKNKRRVLRALEVAILTGQSFTQQQKKGPKLFDALEIGLEIDRAKLYERIDKRVEQQFKDGLVEEAKKLVSRRKYKWNLPSMSGIGYKEAGQYLRGEIGLERAKELIKFRTHDYARRQLTWFRKDKKIKWIKTSKEAGKLVRKFLNK